MENPGTNIFGVKLLTSVTVRPLRIRPLVGNLYHHFAILACPSLLDWLLLKLGSLFCHTLSDNVGHTIMLLLQLILDGSDLIQDL